MSAQTWAKDRILLPRWALLPEYVLFFLLGLAAVIVGMPSLTTVATAMGSVIWGAWTILGALLATIGSFSSHLHLCEKIGCLILMTGSAVSVAAAILAAASTFGIILLFFLALLPTGRFLSLTVRGEV